MRRGSATACPKNLRRNLPGKGRIENGKKDKKLDKFNLISFLDNSNEEDMKPSFLPEELYKTVKSSCIKGKALGFTKITKKLIRNKKHKEPCKFAESSSCSFSAADCPFGFNTKDAKVSIEAIGTKEKMLNKKSDFLKANTPFRGGGGWGFGRGRPTS